MRTSLRWTLLTLFILLLPVWLLLLIPKLNGFGPEPLKQELKQHGAYEQLSTVLHQSENQPGSGQDKVTDQVLVVLRSALTTDYIESKSNTVIDDTTAWVTKQTDAQPVLDLNDIKNQVLTAYPDAQIQIDQLQTSLATAQQELKDHPMPVDGIEGLESDGSASTDEIAKLLQGTNSLTNFVAGDFRINLGQVLTPLYDVYQYYHIAIYLLAIVLALLLAGFILANRGWHARMKGLGWLLVVAAVINSILAALFSVIALKIGPDMIVGMLPSQAEVVGSVGRAVIQTLFANYIQLEATITIAILIIGIALLMGTLFVSKRKLTSTVSPTSSMPATEPNSHSVSSADTTITA